MSYANIPAPYVQQSRNLQKHNLDVFLSLLILALAKSFPTLKPFSRADAFTLMGFISY